MQRSGTLRVLGATLHYQTVGTGPLLLVLQGGAAGADGSDALARHLANRYTILSYDRRGLRRSACDEVSRPLTLETHGDDAHRLLAALTTEPIFALGISLGALIGLDLVARHPAQIQRLVVHEPPAAELLPEAEARQLGQSYDDVEETLRREGLAAAMRKMAVFSGIQSEDREPDAEPPRLDGAAVAGMAANLDFFFTHDVPAIRLHRLDRGALHRERARLRPAAGQTSGAALPHRCARGLAADLDLPLVEFPGGHNGYAFRPRAFAAKLAEVLSDP